MQDDLDSLYDDIVQEGPEDKTTNLPDDIDLGGNLNNDMGEDEDEDDDFTANHTTDPTTGLPFEDNQDDDDDPVIDPIQETQLINDLLRSKGIEDPSAISYEDESGEVVSVDFYELPYEDQLNILQGNDADIDFGLDTHETEVVNFLRTNEVTFDQAIEYYKRQAVEDYIKEQDNSEFEIDGFSDEELFVLDLKSKYDNLTDDELKLELEKETGHPELFKKKVDKIREEYKTLEIQEKEAVEQSKVDAEQEKFNVLKDTLVNVAVSTVDIGGIDLDDEEKEAILGFVLNKDVNGVSAFDKAKDDPKLLFEMAWYATKGKASFEFVHEYYKKQIDSVRRSAYDKGKSEAIKGMPSNPAGKASVKPNPVTNRTLRSNVKSIEDLHD